MLKNDNKGIKNLANKLLHKHFIPYNAAQRGIKEEKLNGKVLMGQYFALSYRDECYLDQYQMLPKEGFTELIKKMLSDERIELKLGVNYRNYFYINKHNHIEFVESGKKTPIVFTGGLDELFDYKYGALPYYSMSVNFCFENRKEDNAHCTIYHDRPYTSCTDFGMLSNKIERKTDLATIVSYEYSGKQANKEEAFDCFPKESTSAKKLYKKYRKLANKIDGLYLCGRLANYRYQDIGNCILEAMKVISSIKLGTMDLVPDYVKYKRPPSDLLKEVNNFDKDSKIKSVLLIGDLSRELPKITVVIPTYKRVKTLERTLQSVYRQDISKEDYDILIVDNDPMPENETHQYLKQHTTKNLYYYKNEVNLGAYGNQNRSILLARTKWVCVVHDDDVLFTNAIRWALNSLEEINDPKTAAILPRQIQVHSDMEMRCRMKEKGIINKNEINRRKKEIKDNKKRWVWYRRVQEDTRRRYWRISRFDCYMVPFLYPAPSYGSLINRDAFVECGGFYEGYPIDDNFTFNRMTKKYHIYLCGQSWGLYSFSTADVTKPRGALQFVDAVVQYRLYMEKRSIRCRIASHFIRKGAYIDAVLGDVNYGCFVRGYNVCAENYQYYSEYKVSEKRRIIARRAQKIWEMWILLRTKLFGKRISFDLIKRSNGEHF